MPRKSTKKAPAARAAVVGTVEQEQPDADRRTVVLSIEERVIVLEGLRLLDKRLEKLGKQKMPAAISEEVRHWRGLTVGSLRELIEDAAVKRKLVYLPDLDRTSRLIIRGAVDVYTTNERAIVPMLQGLGKDELAEELSLEASRFEADTRPKVAELDNLDLFNDQNDNDEGYDE